MAHTISFSDVGKPYQYLAVAANSSAVVFELIIPPSYVAYIQWTANNWFPSTSIAWEVDGELLENLERQTAPVNSPKQEIPPIVARKSIRWTAYNNAGSSHTFEVLQEGIMVKE